MGHRVIHHYALDKAKDAGRLALKIAKRVTHKRQWCDTCGRDHLAPRGRPYVRAYGGYTGPGVHNKPAGILHGPGDLGRHEPGLVAAEVTRILHGAEFVAMEDGKLIHTKHNPDGTTTRTRLYWEDIQEDE